MATIHSKSPREVHKLFLDWGFTEDRFSSGHLIMRAPNSGHTIPITAPGRSSKQSNSHTSGSAKSMKAAAKLIGITVEQFVAGPDLLQPLLEPAGTHLLYDLDTEDLRDKARQAEADLLAITQPDIQVKEAPVARNIAQMNRSRQENIAKRLASAPAPGTSTTLDGVLNRTPGPIHMSRQMVLESLIHMGGVIEDLKGGLATSQLLEIMKEDRYSGEQSALSSLLLSMEADKQIRRYSKGKRTYMIGLLDPVEDVDIEVINYMFDHTTTETEARKALLKLAKAAAEPEPVIEPEVVAAPAPVPAPTPTPAPALPAVSVLSSDDDLWSLLEIILDGPVMLNKDTLAAVTKWMDSTRELLKLKDQR